MTLPRAALLKAVFFASVTLLSSGCVAGIMDLAEGDGLQTVEVYEPFFQVMDVGLQRSMSVEGINGTIHIRGVVGTDKVVIDAIRRVRSDTRRDAEEQLTHLNVFVLDHPDGFLIQTVQPEEAQHRSYEVDYLVTVPAHLAVVVFNTNGSVRIEGTHADVGVENRNGDVVLKDVSGSAWVDLANGVVDTDILLPEGGEILHAVGNGGVRLRVQREASAEIFAGVGNGSISVAGLELLHQVSEPRTFQALMGNGDGLIDLTVGNGWIEVRGR
ncbi:hypothetical protein ACFL3S_04845 [Gemmatimonadota bacterium]